MTPQHLSDEAVAAFADGVLSGHARERARRHVNECVECREAVRVQREAALALRSAAAPALPGGLLDRLRGLPETTPLPSTLPSAITPDGNAMLSVFAPVAALAPSQEPRKTHRARPYIVGAAVVLAGALTAGAVAQQQASAQGGAGQVGNQPASGTHQGGAHPINVFRDNQP